MVKARLHTVFYNVVIPVTIAPSLGGNCSHTPISNLATVVIDTIKFPLWNQRSLWWNMSDTKQWNLVWVKPVKPGSSS